MNKLPTQQIDGLIDGIAVLQELAASKTPIPGVELAARLNLTPTRISRILKTFAYLGFTHCNSSRKYTIGPAMHVMAAQSMAASGLLRRAFEYLELLSDDYVTVALAVLWKRKVYYLFHKAGNVKPFEGIGSNLLYNAEISSPGMALLAEYSDEMLREIFSESEYSELRSRIKDVRREGFALIEREEHYSVAIAIGSPGYAALAVTVPKSTEMLEKAVAQLRYCVCQIEEKQFHSD
jgi:DNA-binding IclR family transcriptional regulator